MANITRMKNGKFDIQQLIPEIRERPEGYKVRFKNTDILVNNYKINFKDNFIAKNPSYTVKGDEIRISDLTPERFIRIEAAGQILFPEKPNANFDISFASKLPLNFNKILSEKFILRGQVSNLYPAEFLPYINKYTPYNFSDIQGNANLRFNVNLRQEQFRANRVYAQANLNNFFIENATGNVIAKFPNKTNIEFNGNINNNNLFIEQAKIESANVNAGLEGAIRNFKAENRDLNLRLNILNSRIRSIGRNVSAGVKPSDRYYRKITKI
ncbi:MAG: DUF748 domain-containing protein [Bacillus subtilis]|nr:DUF748 domain-containing protein [Bacillus subtilis]